MGGGKNKRTSHNDASPKAPTSQRTKKGNAAEAVTFEAYYRKLYGSRWATLSAAMRQSSVKVAMWNKFCRLSMDSVFHQPETQPATADPAKEVVTVDAPTVPQTQSAQQLVRLPCAFPLFGAPMDDNKGSSSRVLDQPPRDELGTPAYYLFDYASALIVEQLDVEPVHRVLDLCAAPGGKSIAIAQRLAPNGSGGELTSNEAKKDRCVRLRRNLSEHFASTAAVLSHVTQREATTWHTPEAFDRVLVDAPCSSERHLLQQAGGTSDWTLQTTHDLAAVQRTLLLRAFEAAKVGGRVVYSTCSISPIENDEVVEFALARTRCQMELVPTVLRVGHATAHGWLVLPDEPMKSSTTDDANTTEATSTLPAAGWGPMFCATFHKVGAHRSFSPSESEASDDDDEQDNDNN